MEQEAKVLVTVLTLNTEGCRRNNNRIKIPALIQSLLTGSDRNVLLLMSSVGNFHVSAELSSPSVCTLVLSIYAHV